MRIEKKENKTIEILEDVKIVQNDHDIILEKGDRIEILSESDIPSKEEIVGYMISVGYNPNEAEKTVEQNYDYLIRVYGGQRLTLRKASEIISSIRERYNPKYVSNPTQRLNLPKKLSDDLGFLLDTLHNASEHMSGHQEFISHVLGLTDSFNARVLKQIWDAWWNDLDDIRTNPFRFTIEDEEWVMKFMK